MKLLKALTSIIHNEKSGGLVLIFATLVSLGLANSPWQVGYQHLWHIQIGPHSLIHWINDEFMTIFFLFIGLELEREILKGELSSFKNALLPILGAMGGMIVPAGIYLLLNYNTTTMRGAGIPMATDIAFAIGILSLLGNRVPFSLKIFLIALAIIDDLGAILIIAIFYTSNFILSNFIISLCLFSLLVILNRLKVHNLLLYLTGGVGVWYFLMHSGIHATIAGVLLAFAIPFADGGSKSPSYKVQHFLHIPVVFLILPLFAMANTGIRIDEGWLRGLAHPYTMGIMAGFLIGKPLGIWLFSFAGVKSGLCALPRNLNWGHITGAGFLGSIGFTMSIFITLLAFTNTSVIINSKIAILLASLTGALIGYICLRMAGKK